MSGLNWSKFRERNQLRVERDHRFVDSQNERALKRAASIPDWVIEKRSNPPAGMRICQNSYCTTFINKKTAHLLCSFHGKRQ